MKSETGSEELGFTHINDTARRGSRYSRTKRFWPDNPRARHTFPRRKHAEEMQISVEAVEPRRCDGRPAAPKQRSPRDLIVHAHRATALAPNAFMPLAPACTLLGMGYQPAITRLAEVVNYECRPNFSLQPIVRHGSSNRDGSGSNS